MSNTDHIHVQNEAEMQGLAARLAALARPGDVITLQGELGAGKTAFCRSFINALSESAQDVPSPTFTLVQTYDTWPEIWHFDLYRIENRDDILELGWEDARRAAVALVEWPERLGSLLPRDRLEISIAFDKDSENARRVRIIPHGRWTDRLKGDF